MGIFVTNTGFKKKTLVEIKAELETSFEGVFGDIDLDAKGPFGQIIGVLSQRESNLFDGAEEIYNSRNPNEATGASLDNIAAETGVRRIDATKTKAENVLLYGDEGIVVIAGKQAKQELNDLLYSLSADTTITKAAARHIELEPDTPAGGGGTVYTVTIDGTPYNYTSLAGDTKSDVIDALIVLITMGTWAGVSSNKDPYLKLLDVDLDFNTIWTATLTLDLLASAGMFTADETGPNALPANTLDTIATPVTGWDSINNPEAGTTGRDVETDQEFRIRRAQTFLAGNATDEAIRSALLNEVTGVQTASVTSNRTMLVDGEGRPPKSFEAVVEGGLDQDVAEEIWDTMPAGIEPYGSTHIVVVDSEGNNQDIYFSRPELMFIYVKVKKNLYNEEEYPANGDAQIKEKIVLWALTEYQPGNDVIRQRLNIPIYEVPGIKDIEVTLDGIVDPGGMPVYLEQNIDISARQLADFDVGRIVIEVLP